MAADMEIRRSYTYSREPFEHHVRQAAGLAYFFLVDEGYPHSKATEASAKYIALVLFRIEHELCKAPIRTRLPEEIKYGPDSNTIVLLSENVKVPKEDHEAVKIVTDMYIEPDPAWANLAINTYKSTNLAIATHKSTPEVAPLQMS